MRPTSALPAVRMAPGVSRPQTAGGNAPSSSARSFEGSIVGGGGESARPSSRSQHSARPQTAGGIALPSATRSSGGAGMNALVSTRSQESELSTGEVLRRMREKSDAKKNELDEREIEALGDYNAFSRPKSSAIAPLRSVFLDPSVNNFPRSKTRTELMKRIKVTCTPHPSYDLDNDGYVSQEDYRLAKRFDFDGNGLLDPDERNVGRHILAEEFFKKHEKDISNYGTGFAQNTKKQNVEKLVNSYSFERTYGKLLSVERTLTAESSKPLLDCIRNDEDPSFQKNKYHTNKFDATAWNDYDRVPRSSWMGETFGEDDHGGSRRRLLFARRAEQRRESEEKLERARNNGFASSGTATFVATNPVRTRPLKRTNLISDVRVENS